MLELLQKLGLPPDYSVNGHEVDHLLVLVHWLMALLFVGWSLYFIVVLFKFRAKNNPKASYQGVKSHLSSYLEVAVIVAEAVLLVGFSIPLWAKRTDDFPDKAKSTHIKMVAEQFAWNFHYPGADGVFGKTAVEFMNTSTNPLGIDPNDPAGNDDITTLNQMYIPVNKPVILEMMSKDVIHCFALPAFRVKQDIIPGQNIPIWFEAKGTGNFHIACEQLCGIGHYRMKGYINVQTPEEHTAWLQKEAAKAEESDGDDFWD